MRDHREVTPDIESLLETGRMREQLEIARRIQRGFLPVAPPGLHGFEVEGWNEPCYEAGGDYYDFFRLPGGRLALAIGDVSGHGIGSALLMAGARSALRALLPAASGPGDVLRRLNEVLAPDMLDDHFMTMFVAVIDLRSRCLRYALAGHERPLLLRGGADCFARLESRGMPLGIRTGLDFPQAETVALRSGDLIACLTDGIPEAVNGAGEEYGYVRLEAVLRNHRDASAPELLAAVRADIARFAGDTRQSDDLTLMILRVL